MIQQAIKCKQFPLNNNGTIIYNKSISDGLDRPNLSGAMSDQTYCALGDSCSKNECIINQVCSGFLIENGSTNKFLTDEIADPKNNEEFKLNLMETLQSKLPLSSMKSLTNSWKNNSEESVLSTSFFHSADNTYSEEPTVIFDALKSDVLHDSTSSTSCINQNDAALNGNEILFFEKECCEEKSSLKDKVNDPCLENIDESTLSSVPIHKSQRPTAFGLCNYNLDRDLVLQLDEKLNINQIHEVNCEGKFLPEEVIEVPLDICEDNLGTSKYSHIIPPLLCSEDEDVPSKQFQINNNFTTKTFDVKKTMISVHKPSTHNDQFRIENNSPFSKFKLMDDISDHIDLFKIKQFPPALEDSYSPTELEHKSKWKSSFKPVRSPQCKVIKNVETFACNWKNCGAEFFCHEELANHTKNQHCSCAPILENGSHSCDLSDDDNNEDDDLDKKMKKEASSSIKENDENFKVSCKKKRKHLNPSLYNFKDRLIKCGRFECSVKFSSMENLKNHIECHDFSSYSTRSFKCILCKKFFYKWANCSLHLWKAHGLDVDLLTCGICKTYKTNLLGKMAIHQEVHFNDKSYKCEICGRNFKQNSQLTTHICKQKPIEEQPLWAQKTLCNECNKWFTSYKNYVHHYNSIHLKVKKFSCSHCDYQCYTKIHFTTHMRKHTKQKPYTCELCGLSVADHNSIRRHRLTHIPKRKIECPMPSCGFSTVNISVFKMHLLLQHPNKKFKFTCQMCTFECSDLMEYLTHRNIHEEEFLKNNFPKVYSKNNKASGSKEIINLKIDDIANSNSKIQIEPVTKVTINDLSVSKINNSPKLKTSKVDTKSSTFNDLFYIDKRFIKKRKMDENLDFETVLLIE